MDTLTYKGYIGSVDFSAPDNVFFGKIEGIDSLVNYEAESVQELISAFHEAVDDYLIFCEDHGLVPQKSYSGSLEIDLTPDVHCKVASLAKKAGISINAFIRSAVEKQVAMML